jgi:pyruvate,orthophosphate dikinase
VADATAASAYAAGAGPVWLLSADPKADLPLLGEKARGLLELGRIGVPVPETLIVPFSFASAGTVADRAAAAAAAVLAFHRALPGRRPLLSLRCTEKSVAGAADMPESVLDLGIGAKAAEGEAAARAARVCAAHSAAFFAFFGEALPPGFENAGLVAQLPPLLARIYAHAERTGGETARARLSVFIAQRMVFGDRSPRSVTGMCYTSHPRGGTGDYGHFIVGRQGLSLGGIHSPKQRDLSELANLNPATYRTLRDACERVERHHGEIRRLEYTAEDERLFVLQNTAGNCARHSTAAGTG